jgi:hypothetical protein
MFGAHTNPINSGRHSDRAIGFDGDLKTMRMKHFDQNIIQLQQWLADRWKHPRYALWGATALFALGHAPWVGWQALWLMLPGLVLGWVWWRYRRLSLNVLIHAGFNAALVLTTLWI